MKRSEVKHILNGRIPPPPPEGGELVFLNLVTEGGLLGTTTKPADWGHVERVNDFTFYGWDDGGEECGCVYIGRFQTKRSEA